MRALGCGRGDGGPVVELARLRRRARLVGYPQLAGARRRRGAGGGAGAGGEPPARGAGRRLTNAIGGSQAGRGRWLRDSYALTSLLLLLLRLLLLFLDESGNRRPGRLGRNRSKQGW